VQKNTIASLDELKISYYEILNGYSFDPVSSLYVKHFTDKESSLLLIKKIELNKFYEKSGVPSQENLLKTAIQNGSWSQEKEEQIIGIKYTLADNERIIHDIIPEQRGWIESQLDSKRKELREIYAERKSILGRYIEDLVDEDINDYICYICCFKDNEFTLPVVESYDAYQELESEQLMEISNTLSKIYNQFDDEKIKQIAAMPFFLNKLSHCKDNIYHFLGKSLSDLSHNQINLFSLGVKNLNTLSRTEQQPPDLNIEATIQQVTSWYDIQYSIQLAKSKQNKHN